MNSQIPRWLLVCVVGAALGMALFGVCWRVPLVWPLDIHLRDDAYYYFVWAHNLAIGEGPCVTQGIHTSGVHVLWGGSLAALSLVAAQ